jgi:hypothetical protein
LWFGAQIEDLVGQSGAQAVQSMLAEAAWPRERLFAMATGIVMLLFAAPSRSCVIG